MEVGKKSNMEQKNHQRRKRYSGKYPRNFQEKYKELNPEQYQETIQHVIRKGNTPAGTHISICVEEILTFLNIQPGQRGLDATLGYGGHSLRMLEKLNGSGFLYATDVDPIESEKTKKRLEDLGFHDDIFSVRLMNFSMIDQLAKEVGSFHFILADLGVSSMQIDNPDRGFTYKAAGPLDLRMNPTKGITAAERLRELDREELEGMFWENADEPYAAQIAEVIYHDLKAGHIINTTTTFYQEIEKALAFLPIAERREAVKKSSARAFQALRIDINKEYEALYSFLQKLPEALAPGGRVAILTFHSGEDRMVKKSFKMLLQEGVYQEISQEVIRPSREECMQNSRARSAKLRWAIKKE